MSSDDELAAVLSHELSHTLMEHPREALSIAALRRALAVPLLPMLVGGFYARRLFLTAATTYISSGLLAFYLSRRKEEEADYVGMLLMAEAGFDPASRTASWEKMVGWKNRCVEGSSYKTVSRVSDHRICFGTSFAPNNPTYKMEHRNADSNFTNSAGIGLLQAPAWLSTHPTVSESLLPVYHLLADHDAARLKDSEKQRVGTKSPVNYSQR